VKARAPIAIAVAGSYALFLSACDEPEPECGGYPAQETSPYVLPWAAGASFPVYTGNCRKGNATHSAGG
jgi:hypothetical protein